MRLKFTDLICVKRFALCKLMTHPGSFCPWLSVLFTTLPHPENWQAPSGLAPALQGCIQGLYARLVLPQGTFHTCISWGGDCFQAWTLRCWSAWKRIMWSRIMCECLPLRWGRDPPGQPRGSRFGEEECRDVASLAIKVSRASHSPPLITSVSSPTPTFSQAPQKILDSIRRGFGAPR